MSTAATILLATPYQGDLEFHTRTTQPQLSSTEQLKGKKTKPTNTLIDQTASEQNYHCVHEQNYHGGARQVVACIERALLGCVHVRSKVLHVCMYAYTYVSTKSEYKLHGVHIYNDVHQCMCTYVRYIE